VVSAVGVVMTGGASRRMGRDKATLAIDGVPMASRVADRLVQAGCQPVLCVGGDEGALRALGFDVIADRWPGEGPLGGLVSVMHAVTDADLVVVACDLLDLDTATVTAMIEAPAADVAVANSGRRQPLCARWSAGARGAVSAAFERGERSMEAAIRSVVDAGGTVIDVAVTPSSMRNVNRPEDLAG
jgi:molybdenum cofactor guanylyltransferase